MHVCVIGAGVTGLTTAYFLHAEGHEVTLVDRASGPASGASRANGAQLSYAFMSPLADAPVPSRLLSLLLSRDSPSKLHLSLDPALWRWLWACLRAADGDAARTTTTALLKLAELSREFIEPLIEGEGIDCHFTRGGKLVVYPDQASLAAARAQTACQATHGAVQKVLDADACVLQEPALAPYRVKIAGGVWMPDDAAADCGAFCDRLAALLGERGVAFEFGRSVQRLDVAGGQVRAALVGAAAGGAAAPLRADAYVLANGADASSLGATAGLALPIRALKGYSITVKPVGGVLPRASISDARRKVVFAPLGDRVRVSGFIEIGGHPTAIPAARIGALLEAAREVLGYQTVDGDLAPWAGLRPATPTGRPMLGRTPLANLYLNVGAGALGWTLAAGCARLVCDAIARRAPTIDPAPFTLVG